MNQVTAHDRAKRMTHETLVIDKELDRLLAEYHSFNTKFFNAPEMNDLRRHFKAMDEVPTLITMLQEEIQIIKRHGPRPAPFWDAID